MTTEIGFDEAIPMKKPSPGVVDVIAVYEMYAAQIREIHNQVSAASTQVTSVTTSANAGADLF